MKPVAKFRQQLVQQLSWTLQFQIQKSKHLTKPKHSQFCFQLSQFSYINQSSLTLQVLEFPQQYNHISLKQNKTSDFMAIREAPSLW
jgi:hypothetical protein